MTWYAHDADDGNELKVLFVGNSLTYYHDMPGMVVGMFEHAQADQSLKVAMVTGPGLSLDEHLAFGRAEKAIEEFAPWDWVVLQEQGGLVNVEPERVRRSLTAFVETSRNNGVKPAILLFDSNVSASCNESLRRLEQIASTLNVPCVRVSDAWCRAVERHPELDLLLDDRIHPSEQGSYVIALVLYSFLSGEIPVDMPTKWSCRKLPENELVFDVDLPKDIAAEFQTSAGAAARRPAERK